MTRVAAIVALVLACVAAQAQERASLVSTELRVVGEVQRELTLTVEELRTIATRRALASGNGYTGLRLIDLLEEADIRRDARLALRRTYVVAAATDGFQPMPLTLHVNVGDCIKINLKNEMKDSKASFSADLLVGVACNQAATASEPSEAAPCMSLGSHGRSKSLRSASSCARS